MLRPLRISLSRTEHRALTRVAALAVFSRRISAYRLHSPTVSLGAASWEWANRCPTGGIGAELPTSAMHFFVSCPGYTDVATMCLATTGCAMVFDSTHRRVSSWHLAQQIR